MEDEKPNESGQKVLIQNLESDPKPPEPELPNQDKSILKQMGEALEKKPKT